VSHPLHRLHCLRLATPWHRTSPAQAPCTQPLTCRPHTHPHPPHRCYCAKNWYMTEQCRILGEKHTQFPFNCSLGDFIKPRKLVDGLQVQDRNITVRCGGLGPGPGAVMRHAWRRAGCRCAPVGVFLGPHPCPHPCPFPRPPTRREHTFLDNPRTPAAVKASVAVVKVRERRRQQRLLGARAAAEQHLPRCLAERGMAGCCCRWRA
jgi:hypothetical protein